MSVVYKINDRVVSEAELEEWHAERVKMFGEDFFNPAKWGGKAPSIRTNDTFMRGKKHGADLDMTDETFGHYKRKAEAAGVSTSGKHYYGSLATRPGDPEAWCGSADDAIATAKRKGMRIEINGRTYDFRRQYDDTPDDEYNVAPDIVAREVNEQIKTEGGKVSKKRRREIEEEVRDELTPSF
jgi:hypothetical protein